MALFGNSRELRSGTRKLWQEASPEDKEDKCSFIEEGWRGELGRAVIDKKSIGANWELEI